MKKADQVFVFVYGSLRKGASNHWRLDEAIFIRKEAVAGTLLKIDWYPGLILGGESLVKGELYQVSPELLAELDAFEGIGQTGEYRRVKVGDFWVYEWLKGTEGYEMIRSGDWSSLF